MKLLVLFVIIIISGCSTGPKSSRIGSGAATAESADGMAADEGDLTSLGDEPSGKEIDGRLDDLVDKKASRADERTAGAGKRTTPEVYRSLVAARDNKDTAALTEASAKLLAEKADDLPTLNLLAMYYYERRNYQLAKLILGRAFNKAPNSATLHANYGLVLLAEGEERDGIHYLQKARDLDGDHFAANATLGTFYLRHYSFSKAATLLAKAYAKKEDDMEVANNYAIALRGLGKFDDAEDIYKSLLAKSNSSEQLKVLYNYAVLLIDYMNKPEEGLKLIYKVNFIGPERGMLEELKVLEKKAKDAVK